MIEKILAPLIGVLISLVPENIIKDELTKFIDNVEQRIKESDTKIDDIILIPILDLIRKNLSLNTKK